MRAAVVKSVVLRLSVIVSPPAERLSGRARSTMPPLGMRPALGTLTDTREPSLPCAPKPPTIRLPWAIAYTCPSAPLSGAINRAPPRSEVALPSDETVTSICWPGLAKGGSSAWIATAATFFSCGLTLEGTATPSSASMFLMLCTVKGA